MMPYGLIWMLLLVSLGLLMLTGFQTLLWMKFMRSQIQNQNQIQSSLISALQKEKQDLLNRLMSQDVQTFSMMTASTTSSRLSNSTEQYVSQSDKAELQRLVQAQGLGAEIYDDQTDFDSEMLNDILPGGRT